MLCREGSRSDLLNAAVMASSVSQHMPHAQRWMTGCKAYLSSSRIEILDYRTAFVEAFTPKLGQAGASTDGAAGCSHPSGGCPQVRLEARTLERGRCRRPDRNESPASQYCRRGPRRAKDSEYRPDQRWLSRAGLESARLPSRRCLETRRLTEPAIGPPRKCRDVGRSGGLGGGEFAAILSLMLWFHQLCMTLTPTRVCRSRLCGRLTRSGYFLANSLAAQAISSSVTILYSLSPRISATRT